jgi:hypothetical protein
MEDTQVKYTVDTEKLKEMIGFSPHAAQQQILDGEKRFTIIMAGRQMGKSLLISYVVLRELLGLGKKIWIVAPNYDLTQRIFKNYLLPVIRKYPDDFKVQMDRYRIECIATGSSVECKSAENPVALLGETLDLLVIDEAAEVAEQVFESNLRPTLMVKKGKCMLISTPTTRTNWFFRKYVLADENEDSSSFHFTSYDNPYIDAGELEAIRKRTPEMVWRNQYLAEPVEDGGKLFTGVRSVVTGKLEDPVPGKRKYILAWDPAKTHDYSAVIVVDREKKHVVAYDRFSGLDWTLQIERVIGLAHTYNNAIIVMDATGSGDPLFETLQNSIHMKNYPIYTDPYKMDTSEKKKAIIENLAVMIQNWEITYPDIRQLIEELSEYGYTLSPAGNVKYSAPKGMFDDMVIALALACWEMKKMPYIQETQQKQRGTNFVRVY